MSTPSPTQLRRVRSRLRLSPDVQAVGLVLFSFLGASVGGVVAKGVYAFDVHPSMFLTIRLATALVAIALLRGHKLVAIPRPQIVRLIVLGLGFGVQTILFYTALSHAPVGVVLVIVAAYPLVVLSLDAIGARAMPKAKQIGLMIVALAGLWLAAGRPGGSLEVGLLFSMAAAVGFALYLRGSAKATEGVGPLVATGWMMSGALITVSIYALAVGPSVPPAPAVALAMFHGLVCTILPTLAVYTALATLSSSRVAALGPLEPVFGIAMGGLFLGERLDVWQAIGVVVVLGAVALQSEARPRLTLPRLPTVLPRAVRSRPARSSRPVLDSHPGLRPPVLGSHPVRSAHGSDASGQRR